MDSSFSNLYQNFCDDTKTSFYLNIAAIAIIFLLLTRKQNTFSSHIGRLITIILLGVCLLINIRSSSRLLDWKNMGSLLLNPSLAEIRNNLLLNCVYCILVFIFIVYLVGEFI